MEINKDSKVSAIGGVKSDINLFELCQHLGISDEIEYVVEDLNDNKQFDIDGYGHLDNYDGIRLTVYIPDDDGVTELFEKVFGEKYLMMVSSRFNYENLGSDEITNHCIKWNEGYSEDFVESVIEDDRQVIKEVITKEHYEDEILEINESNFLSDEEASQVKNYEDDDEISTDFMMQKIVIILLKKVNLTMINGGWVGLVKRNSGHWIRLN